MVNKYFVIVAMVSLFFLGGIYGCRHTRPTQSLVKVNFIDFAPQDGDYDLNWPGPPRRPWTNADKEYYKATIELDVPAPETFNLHFYVKESKFGSDPKLGYFTATFNRDAKRSQPTFWLVCTKAGKVKGNVGKGDDRHANVYLESNGLASDVDLDTWTWEITASRWEHDINCE